MSNRNRNNLPNNLAQLQNLIKRDPESYIEDFTQQWRHYESNLELFKLNPSQPSETMQDLVMFIAQVGNLYEDLFQTFPDGLRSVLAEHYSNMDPSLRMTMCRSLMLLRNKNLISPLQVLELFFELLKAKDKLLRKTLYNHIVTDIKNINAKHKNNKVNTALQNYMFGMLRDNNANAAKMSLDIMIELYRKGIWKDTRTVNVIVTACHSKMVKVTVTALKFFLGTDTPDDEKNGSDSDSDSEPDQAAAKKLLVANTVTKKTGKKKKKLEKALSLLRKSKKKSKPVSFNFSAIHLINDPQGFSEKLFKQVEASTDRFEVKLMTMNLISRLVGIHELILLNFYPYLQRFLQPHQREVTKLLMCAAQASHEMVPPDTLEPVLMAIANNFVSERNSVEVMAVGLNAIREICARAPLAMTGDLLQDLVQYKTTRNKTVMMAARSLLHLYRNVDASLLMKKDRGRPQESGILDEGTKDYGASKAPTYVPGAELLNDEDAEEAAEPKKATKVKFNVPEGEKEGDQDVNDEEEEQMIDGWETDSEDDDERETGPATKKRKLNKSKGSDDEDLGGWDSDSDGWEQVSHSEDEMEQDAEEIDPKDLEVKKRAAEDVSTNRFLTDADFKKIQERSIANVVDGTGAGKKRKVNSTKSEQDKPHSNKEIVQLGQIEHVTKKAAHDKASRLATVIEGRKDREAFTKPKKQRRQNEFASTSNKDKLKCKPFMMISHSKRMRGKVKKSFRDKQIALRDALMKNEKGKKMKY